MRKLCPVNAFRGDCCLQTLFRCQKFVFNSPLSQFILSLALAIDRAYSGRIFAFQTFQAPAFSTPSIGCRVFLSRVFHPCSRVPRFPLPRFSAFLAYSCIFYFCDLLILLPHFHCCIFTPAILTASHFSLII